MHDACFDGTLQCLLTGDANMFRKAALRSGSATIEYAIIMPVAIACVVAVIVVFECLYQQSAIQTLAEQTAEGLSMIWGHDPVSEEDIVTGAYSRESFDSKQLYWQVLPTGKYQKTGTAKGWIEKQLDSLGLLEEIEDRNAEVTVSYQYGFPLSKVKVSITAYYEMPGAAALKYIGMGNLLIIKGQAEAPVYDQKEMINVSDYIIQKVMETNAGEFINKIAAPLKKVLKMLE